MKSEHHKTKIQPKFYSYHISGKFDYIPCLGSKISCKAQKSMLRVPLAGELELETPEGNTAENDVEDDPLYALPTPAELRSIRGRRLGPMPRAFAAAAIAAVVGGIAFSILSGDPEPSGSDLSNSMARTLAKTNRQSDGLDRTRTPVSDRAQPGSDDAPLILVQPGDGFLPIEKLREAEKRRRGLSLPLEPSANRTSTSQNRDSFPIGPAAIARFGDNGSEE